MWNGDGDHIFWQIDSEWSKQRSRNAGLQYSDEAQRVLSLYEREKSERLSSDEYAWLAERGYIRTTGDYYGGRFRSFWQIVVLSGKEIQNQLLAIGGRIKEKYRADFEALLAPYADAVLASVPPHLKKVKEYELQSVFGFDGWFLLHCIVALLKNGKLKEPAREQRKALTTLIVPV